MRRQPPAPEETEPTGLEPSLRDRVAARLAAGRPAPANDAPRGAPRDMLLAVPGFEPRPPVRRPAEPAPATPADLGAELEAALMGDLKSMVDQFDHAAREPAPARAPSPPIAQPVDTRDDADQEALERLLASIRSGDGAPRPVPPPAEEPRAAIEAAPAPATVAAPAAKRTASPRPSGRPARMAPPARSRQTAPDDPGEVNAEARPARRSASKAVPQPPLKLAIPGARRSYLKPVIAGSILILLAAVGAGMTVRALTSGNDTETAAAAPPASTPPAVPAEAATQPETAAPKTAALEAAAPETAGRNPPAPAMAEPAAAAASPVAAAGSAAPDAAASAQESLPDAAVTLPPDQPAVRSATDNGPAATAMTEATRPEIISAAPSAPELALPAFAAPSMASPAEIQPAAQPEAIPSAAPETASAATAAPKPAAAAPAARSGLQAGPARIASGVKLRTNPDNGAPVIGLLAAGASVQIVGCKGWCEIVAGDKRGFVYQKFLSQAGG